MSTSRGAHSCAGVVLLLLASPVCIAQGKGPTPESNGPATASSHTPADSTGGEVDAPFVLATEALRSGAVTLSNGVVVRRSDWPALVVAVFGTPTAGQSSCTGSLIGPNTMLTAAHCIENSFGMRRKPFLRSHGRDIPMLCEFHPDYGARPLRGNAPRGPEDYALCRIDYGEVVPNAIKQMRFEVVDVATEVARGSTVLLTGYGCTDAQIIDGELFKKVDAKKTLRIGDAPITRATQVGADDAEYVLIESKGVDTPTLCPGDSGGPMFIGATQSSPTSRDRRIAGVNSAIAPGESGAPRHIISKVSATATPAFSEWLTQWQARNQRDVPIVCGLTRKLGEYPCRGAP